MSCQFKYFLALCLISNIAFGQKPVPELWGQRVHDEAHALKQETIDSLERKLKVYEDSTSNQIAILIVQSLDGEVLEEYALRVAEKWKLGQEKKDNGVLLLIAIDDHKMRIEVGHGLEGVLTDAQSNRIIRNEMAPNFRRDDYDAGVSAAVGAMVKAIGGEYESEGEAESMDDFWIVVGVLMGIFFIALLVFSFVKEFRRPGVSSSGEKTTSTRSSDSDSSWSTSSSSSSGSSFSGGGGSFGGGGSSGSW